MTTEQYPISASQIKTHSRCPLSYWYSYLSDKEPSKADNDYMKLGSRVHEAIEKVLLTSPDQDDVEHLKTRIIEVFALNEEYEIPDDLYQRGLECCETAAAFIEKERPSIVGVEERVGYDINRPDISTPVTAIMDVCTETEIWDWKTGRIREDSEHEERIQGSVYMGAYYDKYGRPPERIRFVYLSEGKVRNLDPTDDNWSYMLTRAKRLLESKHNNDYPAKPGPGCYWCEFEYWCHASPVGMGDVPWEDY